MNQLKLPFRDRILGFEWLKASDLIRNPKNPRTHSKAQSAALEGILGDVGWADAIKVRKLKGGKFRIVDGHLRADQSASVPCLILDLNDREEEELLALLDPIGEMAGRDQQKLDALLGGIETQHHGISKLLEQLGSKGRQVVAGDEVQAPKDEGPVKRGDTWQLGPHRLVVADSFLEETREQLLGKKPDLAGVVTDPPYAIYGSSSGIGADIADDKMVRPFFESLLRISFGLLPTFAHVYLCCDWRSWSAIWESGKRAGIFGSNMIVWDKGAGGVGSMWANCHELVFFGVKRPDAKTMRASTRRGQRTVMKPNLQRHNRTRDKQHNAAKPVPLMEQLVEAAADAGGKIWEPFAGSGSTLLACENLGRVCYASEIEPVHAWTTIRRWESATGKKAKRE